MTHIIDLKIATAEGSLRIDDPGCRTVINFSDQKKFKEVCDRIDFAQRKYDAWDKEQNPEKQKSLKPSDPDRAVCAWVKSMGLTISQSGQSITLSGHPIYSAAYFLSEVRNMQGVPIIDDLAYKKAFAKILELHAKNPRSL